MSAPHLMISGASAIVPYAGTGRSDTNPKPGCGLAHLLKRRRRNVALARHSTTLMPFGTQVKPQGLVVYIWCATLDLEYRVTTRVTLVQFAGQLRPTDCARSFATYVVEILAR